MRNLSNNMLSQLFAQESDDPFLTLFTLDHADWVEPLYLVNNTESITSNGNEFIPFPVSLTLPAEDGEGIKAVKISFDNVSRELIEEIREVTDNSITVTIQMVLTSTPDVVEIELGELKIITVTYNSDKIEATLTVDDFLNLEMTSEKYTPTSYPGLF